eukprot:15445467-Alexandrium_andersonii.AAC.1
MPSAESDGHHETRRQALRRRQSGGVPGGGGVKPLGKDGNHAVTCDLLISRPPIRDPATRLRWHRTSQAC